MLTVDLSMLEIIMLKIYFDILQTLEKNEMEYILLIGVRYGWFTRY